ncbi:sigma-70 family RNA polymerase sigma factor [Telluribacter sp.]|jgi:RNA polymerase sigma factor (sigma-70 family)|uniref:RNA polymerase sigma factor n=1 Tax=Telluribacter sp. TaxID=1978767 RepID=UPI002E12C582|nr:sigma-70 family RNA polymerase sigma factor [Telluribacter sp.]
MNLGDEFIRTEAQQWELLRAGNTAVFEEVFKSYYSLLFNYCLRFQNDEDEIKDCLQILFLTIWERREYLGPTTSIRGYLLASLRRLVLKRIKENSKYLTIDPDTFDFQPELSSEALMIREQTTQDNLRLLQQALESLPTRQKEALYLKFYGEQSFAEIAEIMDISTRAVYKLIYKGLDTLSAELRLTTDKVPFLFNFILL